MEILRKLTVKAIVGSIDIEALIKAEGQRVSLARIYGIARKAKFDQSDMGSFIRFFGAFKGVNLQTGEEFTAGSCILPGVAQDLLYGAFDSETSAEVSFAFEIGVKFDKTAVMKYVYTAEPLLKPDQSDPLSMLQKKVNRERSLPLPGATSESGAEGTEAPAKGAEGTEAPAKGAEGTGAPAKGAKK